jgi:peptidoglycan DL-endopeptidase CwlO
VSRYRRRWRRGRGLDSRSAGAAVVAGVALAALAHTGAGAVIARAGGTAPSHAGARAVAFARAQLGCPYVWGGTGPCGAGYDCSGLVMQAYASARVSIPRTSQEQWASLPHANVPVPGDLVFFAGGDGTPSAPGHVGLVTGPHTMIEAYAPGFPVRVSAFGTSSAAPGDEDPVGYAAPGGAR